MGEIRRLAAERLEELDLHGGIDDMILAADHMGDAEVDIIDDRRQGVEIGPVFSHQHRIRQVGRIDMLRSAYEIVPFDDAVLELEAPMRPASLRFERLAVLIAELEGGAVRDGRALEREAR